ncbi:Golgi apparatus membrane protein tvp18 [Linnemannia zychae]|nr:Golgi apparatus membrane protein tvp18 [Linnemannia zychae]
MPRISLPHIPIFESRRGVDLFPSSVRLFFNGLIVFGAISILNIPWNILGWVIAFLLIFIEIPFLMKCCPTSAKFDNFLQKFQNSYFRALIYVIFAAIMWLGIGLGASKLQVVSALALTFGAISYIIAAVRQQTPASSTITGGAGVSTIV